MRKKEGSRGRGPGAAPIALHVLAVILCYAGVCWLASWLAQPMGRPVSLAAETPDPKQPCGGLKGCMCWIPSTPGSGVTPKACEKCGNLCKGAANPKSCGRCGNGCQCDPQGKVSCSGWINFGQLKSPCGCYQGGNMLCTGEPESNIYNCCTGCGGSGLPGVGCDITTCTLHCGSGACPCGMPTVVACLCPNQEGIACVDAGKFMLCKLCPRPGNSAPCKGLGGGGCAECKENTYR